MNKKLYEFAALRKNIFLNYTLLLFDNVHVTSFSYCAYQQRTCLYSKQKPKKTKIQFISSILFYQQSVDMYYCQSCNKSSLPQEDRALFAAAESSFRASKTTSMVYGGTQSAIDDAIDAKFISSGSIILNMISGVKSFLRFQR